MVLWILCAVFLSGCGAGTGSGDTPIIFDTDALAAAEEPQLSPTLPEVGTLLSQQIPAVSVETGGIGDSIVAAASIPSEQIFQDQPDLVGVHSVTTLANTGLRLGFKGEIDSESIDASFVEASWSDMQTCLNVVAQAPLVIVSSDTIVPLTLTDDVLFHIDGSITATSTQYATGASIQISSSDLDGSLNRIGFNLRSIMGRHLWASANLPERDYPHSCASQG